MTAWRRNANIVLVWSIAACSSAESKPTGSGPDGGAPACTEGTPGCIGWVTCPPEFEKDGDGSCREVVPEAECPAGTMPVLGSRECAPVGPGPCASGFEVDPSGWGCRAIVPAKACTGATRDAIGSTSCVPVGDCNAPFPPAGALVVNAAFSDAELGPKKFRSIDTAVRAAKAGETVAIETGEYAEGIVARSNITIVGRCAEKVRLVGTTLEVHGVLANGTKDVLVKGVTLEGHYEGARVMAGGSLTLEDVVIEAPRFVGLIAWQASSAIHADRVVIRKVKPHASQPVAVQSVNADEGGSVELVDSSIAERWEAGVVATNANASKTPSSVKLHRSVIRDTNIDERSQSGAGIVVSGVSRGEVTESAILDTRRIGALTVFAEPELVIARSEIRRTLDDASEEISAGVYAEGGKITLEDVSIHDAVQGGLLARSEGTITARNTVVHGTKPGADGLFGVGAWADSGAKLVLEGTALVDNAYYGVSILDSPASASLKNVLIRGTAEQKIPGGGLGRGVNVEDGAAVDLDSVSIVANDGAGLFLRGETKDGKRARATAKRLLVADGRTFGGTGVFVAKGALAEIEGALVRGAQRAGVIVNETTGGKGSRSEATLTHVVVRDTKRNGKAHPDEETIALDGIGIGSAGTLTVRASAIVDNVQFGVIIGSPKGFTSFENTFIGATKPNADGSFGHGLVAFTGSNLVIRDSELVANNVGLVFDGAAAVLAGSRIRGNSVGIHAQRGSALVTGSEPPELPESGIVFVTDDSEFVDNESRVGGGELPLPANPFAGTTPRDE